MIIIENDTNTGTSAFRKTKFKVWPLFLFKSSFAYPLCQSGYDPLLGRVLAKICLKINSIMEANISIILISAAISLDLLLIGRPLIK